MAGNVWEWTNGLYHYNYYQMLNQSLVTVNPSEPEISYNSYYAGYRNSSRMKSSPDSGMSLLGFRCIKDIE